MPPGDWGRIEKAARENHWNVDQPGRWTMVLSRATRSLTLYFESETGDLERVIEGGREVRAGNARLRASRVLQIIRTG